MMLVEIAPPHFDVRLDLRYASPDNLTAAPIYRRPVALLHPDAARCLERATALAAALGYRLRLFDAFRPVEAQWRLWLALPDPQFIADPRVGSAHSRAVAIDLTLEHADGSGPLDLGTGFDAMTTRSYHGCLDISAEAQRHRAVLLGIMVAAGWIFYPYEWWHYQLPLADRYPLLADSAAGGLMMAE